MREPANDIIRLKHILESIDRISEFTDGLDEQALNSNVLHKHATAYNIQIIGEAVYKLSKEFKATHSEVPWSMIEKMRHILVHDYYQVNSHIMWLVISEDIPALKPLIEKYSAEAID